MEQVQKLIDEKINPLLKLHNGSCEVVSLDGELLSIRLNGGCVGCPSSKITLFNYVIPIIKESFPQLEVILSNEN